MSATRSRPFCVHLRHRSKPDIRRNIQLAGILRRHRRICGAMDLVWYHGMSLLFNSTSRLIHASVEHLQQLHPCAPPTWFQERLCPSGQSLHRCRRCLGHGPGKDFCCPNRMRLPLYSSPSFIDPQFQRSSTRFSFMSPLSSVPSSPTRSGADTRPYVSSQL